MRRLASLTLFAASLAFSSAASAQGLPAPPSPREGFRALLLSDIAGSRPASGGYDPAVGATVARALREWQPSLLLSPGNVVSGQSLHLNRAQLGALWAGFDRTVALPLRRAGVPMLLSLGANDASAAANRAGRYLYALNRAAAQAYLRASAPSPESGLILLQRSEYPFRYTALYRPCAAQQTCPEVFFVVLEANVPSSNTAWLEAQLSRPEAQLASMRVVLGHLPLHSVGVGAPAPQRNPEGWRAVMERYGVHSYISGSQGALFAARSGSLNLLMAGGLYGRDYLGYPGSGRSVVSLLDFYPERGLIELRHFDARTGEPLPSSALPASLRSGGTVLESIGELRER